MTLKPQQLDAIRCIYKGKGVFLWLPTGFEKSVCYEVLPYGVDKRESGQGSNSVVLIVSPLVSLMIDQVSSLREWG